MFKYISGIFSSGPSASFARWATAATVATGCWVLIHIVRHNHALPNAMDLTALAAWMISPYSINKIVAAFGVNKVCDSPCSQDNQPTPRQEK
jgi:hypothetical protein